MILELNKIYNMNCLEGMELLDDKSIDMSITSPPYWGLRDYGDETVSVWDGDEKCKHEWNKYTRDSNKYDKKPTTGTTGKQAIIGSTNYSFIPERIQGFCVKCGAWKGQLGLEPTPDLYINHLCNIYDEVKRVLKNTGTCWINIGDNYTTNKSLSCIPFKFALEMINRKWILRNTIIWHKPNAMPTSVKDRFTVDCEYLFFFVKNKKYHFEQQFEPYTKPMNRWGGETLKADGVSTWDDGTGQSTYRNRNMRPNPKGKNKRTTWTINTKSFPEAHFAVYPEELIETPIRAGCPKDGTVLDPFIGAGTTAVVAMKLNRNFIGFEINQEYVDIANKRLENYNNGIR